MTVAEDAREAVRARPFLFDALRAGVVNYAAAAEALDLAAETDAVATALRRYAADLDPPSTAADVRVTMHSGIGPAAEGEPDNLLSVADARFAADGGNLTAVVASGDVDARALEAALGCLRTAGVGVEATGIADGELVVVVGRRDGATAVRAVEAALSS